jgi:hypothetical protein
MKTRGYLKIAQFLEKVAKNSCKTKECQNIYIKAKFESSKYVHLTIFESSKHVHLTIFESSKHVHLNILKSCNTYDKPQFKTT